jgi:hypothetical protein
MHDYIIGALIIIIVIVQFTVAITTSKKISLFKTIVPDIDSFETVKVFIREDQIKTITVEEILNNINRFSSATPFLAEEIQDKIVVEKNPILPNILENIKNKNNHDELNTNDEFESDLFAETIDIDDIEEDTIWMSKGNLEEKIPKSQMYQYEDMGWFRLKDKKYIS